MKNFLLQVVLGLVAVASADECYGAPGMALGENYIPCNSGSGFSSCCSHGDFCLEDGACWGPHSNMTYIAGCTDSSYEDSSCPDNQGACKKDTKFVGIAICDETNWVCCDGKGQRGDNPTKDYSPSCPCDAGFATIISGASKLNPLSSLPYTFNDPAPTTAKKSDSPTTAAATTTQSNPAKQETVSTTFSMPPFIVKTATATASHTSAASSGGMSSTTKLGIGIGVPLGVIVIGLICGAFWFFGRRRERNRNRYSAGASTIAEVGEAPPYIQNAGAYAKPLKSDDYSSYTNSPTIPQGQHFQPLHEAPNTQVQPVVTHELPYDQMPQPYVPR